MLLANDFGASEANFMSEKDKSDKSDKSDEADSRLPDIISSAAKDLNPRRSLKEHMMIAGVLGGMIAVVLLGVFLAFQFGVFDPGDSSPLP